MAQLQSTRLHFEEHSVDSGQESGLAFAASVGWAKLTCLDQNGTERYIHVLLTQTTPSGDSYKNAVKGSIAIDIVNGAIYRKTAAAGTDGWGAFN